MAVHKPTGTWYKHFRKRSIERTFAVALLVSGVFHISMVTVFKIVTYIPRVDIQYAALTIVPVSADVESPPAAGAGTGAETSDGRLALRGIDAGGGPPLLRLPTLEFAELGRLRVREESDPAPSRPSPLFREPSDDSWARFSRGLSDMSRQLTRLRLSGGEERGVGESGLPSTPVAPEPVSRPAEGFEAYIVWASEPRDRKLLFAPPIEALWGAEAAQIVQPIEMVLQVNAIGRVVNVFSPNLDARTLVDAVQLSALQYRFDPLPAGDTAVQTATLRIQREQAGPEE